jgi:hypothetical protein
MTLPVSRNTTYLPHIPDVQTGTQVKSVDMNAMQDALCGVYPHFVDDFFKLDTELWEVTADPGGAAVVAAGGPHYLAQGSGSDINELITTRTKFTMGSLVGLPRFRARIRFATTVADRFDLVGLIRQSGGSTSMQFTRDTSVAPEIQFEVRGGAGVETVDTGVSPAADTWYVLEAVIVDSTHVAWRVATSETGAALASGTLTLGGAIDDANENIFSIETQNLSGAVRSMLVDYVSVVGARPA